mgnify:CR=1 FL=1
MKTVSITNSYKVAPSEIWKIVVNYSDLRTIAGRAISFEGLPDGEITQGQSVTATISLLGLLPRQAYSIDITKRDDFNFVLCTQEHGAGLTNWNHTVKIWESCGTSYLVDIVEIDAGWLTMLATLWAKFIYRRRHAPRRLLLDKLAYQ